MYAKMQGEKYRTHEYDYDGFLEEKEKLSISNSEAQALLKIYEVKNACDILPKDFHYHFGDSSWPDVCSALNDFSGSSNPN